MQGDIIAIVDELGEVIVEYSYDAWGKVTFSESSLQNMTKASTLCFVSPFTYRGYCYDYDIELYYLQSRYYSAEIGRFINTDDTQIAIATQGEILGANLFAYCNNNPVMGVDYNGTIPITTIYKILQGVLGGVLGAVFQYLSDLIMVKFFGGSWSPIYEYIISVASGVWDAISNTGFFKALFIAVGKSILSQLLDKIFYKIAFSGTRLIESIVVFLIEYILEKVIKVKVPSKIRDIKAKARSLGIKGTRKLTKYLEKVIFKKNMINISIWNVKSFFVNIANNVLKNLFGKKAHLLS
ncbi:MAG: RHS repeat-associated core domain-containing protein [Clostridia bacterium]|nr:RHS repeat-associated core domain-containing protein [Clostridia bacterium]